MKSVQISTGGNLRKKKPGIWTKLKRDKFLLFLFLPGFLIFVLFKYVPLSGIIMAFEDYTFKGGLFGSEFVGLAHFKKMLQLPDFMNAFRNTITISLLKIVFGFPAPIILALIFNEIRNEKFKRITQTITYLPHFFSWVVMSGLLISILSPNSGIVNMIITFFGGKPIYFLANKTYFVPVLVISDIWKEIGWGSIVYLAALSAIPQEMYEACALDGASRLQRMVYVTLPGIASTVSVMLILKMGGILEAGFDQIFNLYNASVMEVADIIDTYVYRMGIESFEYSFATAASLFKSVIALGAVLLTNFCANKLSDGENGIL